MNYSIVVTGHDLQRLQEEVNAVLEGYDARIKAMEAKPAPKAKTTKKVEEKA